jgi:hypothetical protein
LASALQEKFSCPLPASADSPPSAVDGEAVLGFVTFVLNYRLRIIQDTEIASLKRDVAEAQHLTEQERLARMKIEERMAPRHIAEADLHGVIAAMRPHASAAGSSISSNARTMPKWMRSPISFAGY